MKNRSSNIQEKESFDHEMNEIQDRYDLSNKISRNYKDCAFARINDEDSPSLEEDRNMISPKNNDLIDSSRINFNNISINEKNVISFSEKFSKSNSNDINNGKNHRNTSSNNNRDSIISENKLGFDNSILNSKLNHNTDSYEINSLKKNITTTPSFINKNKLISNNNNNKEIKYPTSSIKYVPEELSSVTTRHTINTTPNVSNITSISSKNDNCTPIPSTHLFKFSITPEFLQKYSKKSEKLWDKITNVSEEKSILKKIVNQGILSSHYLLKSLEQSKEKFKFMEETLYDLKQNNSHLRKLRSNLSDRIRTPKSHDETNHFELCITDRKRKILEEKKNLLINLKHGEASFIRKQKSLRTRIKSTKMEMDVQLNEFLQLLNIFKTYLRCKVGQDGNTFTTCLISKDDVESSVFIEVENIDEDVVDEVWFNLIEIHLGTNYENHILSKYIHLLDEQDSD